jgi:hypothetical protein
MLHLINYTAHTVKHQNLLSQVVFVQATAGAADDGTLVDDIFHIQAPRGYRNIVHKTKGMLALVKHFNFRHLHYIIYT